MTYVAVYNNAISIMDNSEAECNTDSIEISTILHDVADYKSGYSDDDRRKIIADILDVLQLDFKILGEVVKVINNISYSKNKNLILS